MQAFFIGVAMKELGVKENQQTMTSRELASKGELDQNHRDLLRRIETALKKGRIGERTCTLSSYLTPQNKLQPEYILTAEAVMYLVATSRKNQSPELMLQLMTQLLPTPKLNLALVKEETELLHQTQQENKDLKKKLKDRPEKIISVSSPVNRRAIHQARKDLDEKGMHEMHSKAVRHYRSPVTEAGEDNGHQNNKEGNIDIS